MAPTVTTGARLSLDRPGADAAAAFDESLRSAGYLVLSWSRRSWSTRRCGG